MIRICISGALGRMGQTVARLVLQEKDLKIVFALEHPNHKNLHKDYGILLQGDPLGVLVESNLEKALNEIDVIIDFSSPENTLNLLKASLKNPKPIVIGTTGFTENENQEIYSLSSKIPILQSPNMSLGVNILFYLIEKASLLLKDHFEVEITEVHHSKKKDSPSGTAMQLKKIIQDIYKIQDVVYGREGLVGERPKNQLGIHSLRGGDVVGEHTVHFFSLGERIEISHKATSREIFGKGAILAAKWLYSKPAGYYTMKDVIGI
ncbi:MAG: 4-hydroxy-tetrahydrodipicolinate reductase [Leptonema sp. (in: bacteria)]